MIVHPEDRPAVTWAVEEGFEHQYVREYGVPEPALRIRLGMTTAFFHAGRLVHWRAEAAAEYLDQLMFELTRLFTFCREAGAYPEQHVFLQPGALATLHRPYNNVGGGESGNHFRGATGTRVRWVDDGLSGSV